MWTSNSQISTTFGNAIHFTMEQWFKHRANGTEKNYHMPKHPFLLNLIESFPLKDHDILPELLISCVEHKMAGRIDGLEMAGDKIVIPIDYKSDAEIEKNLEYHYHQLSFYAFILQQFGYEVPYVRVFNYTDQWYTYESPVLEYDPGIKPKVKKKRSKREKPPKETWLKSNNDNEF